MKKEIRICPKCKLNNINLVSRIIEGAPELNWGECKHCGYEGIILLLTKVKKK